MLCIATVIKLLKCSCTLALRLPNSFIVSYECEHVHIYIANGDAKLFSSASGSRKYQHPVPEEMAINYKYCLTLGAMYSYSH